MERCKWCGNDRPFVENDTQVNDDTNFKDFEGAKLCAGCYKTASWAAENPTNCVDCNLLFTDENVFQALLSEDGYSHLNIDGLRAAASQGCQLCRIFLLQDPNLNWDRLFSPLTLFAEVKGAGAVSPRDIEALYFWSEMNVYKCTVAVSALAESNPASSQISQRPPQTDLANENTFQQGRTWFAECLHDHPESKDLPKPQLPTRVIDVGSLSHPVLRIYEPPKPTYENYINLSYCWGRPHFLTTRKDNFESHKKGMNLAELPKTIRDAVIVTRGLGFRYLWVDALCIIQDSLEDKINEIGSMGDIYNHSTLTIAAVSAAAVAEGFLNPKPKLIARLPYSLGDVVGEVQVSHQKVVDLWQETMFTRGWCLQEYLLSPRILLFTDTEVMWSCQTNPFTRPDTTHVSYTYDAPSLPTSPFRRLPTQIFNESQVPTPPTTPPSSSTYNPSSSEEFNLENFKEWTSLVSNYSRRQLTVLSDRLPALSGVAGKYHATWKESYYAGLWSKHFIEFLSWHRSSRLPTEKEVYKELEKWRAPSWSWVSIEGPLEFEFQNGYAPSSAATNRGDKAKAVPEHVRAKLAAAEIKGARMVDCKAELASELLPLGEVTSGRLVLEGQLIPLSSSQFFTKSKAERGTMYWDFWPAMFDGVGEEMMGRCCSLLLGEAWGGNAKRSEAVSLVLEKVDGEGEGRFKRIGVHKYIGKGAGKPWAGLEKRKTFTVV